MPFAAQTAPIANVLLLDFSGLGLVGGRTGGYLVSFSEMSVTPAGIFLGEQQKPKGHSLWHVCGCGCSVPMSGAQVVPRVVPAPDRR